MRKLLNTFLISLVCGYATEAKEKAVEDHEKLQAGFSLPATSALKKKPGIQVEIKMYTDSDYFEESYFFDRSGATLPKSVHYTIRSASASIGMATMMSGGLYDPGGRLVQNISGKSTDSNGWHRGSYDFQAGDEPGIWVLRVSCDKSDYLKASDSRSMHLYSGSGVSSYKMDFDKSSFREESVLENKHLIAVFGNAKVSNKVLIYLYQKDTSTSYTFGRTNIGRFDYKYNRFIGFGEMTSNQSIDRKFSPSLDQEFESLSSASLTLDVSLVYPLNELTIGAWKNISIWEKTGESRLTYERVWNYDLGDLNAQEAADHDVGDVDNDGKNEIIWGANPDLIITENQSGRYHNVWRGEGYNGAQSRPNVADLDHDGLNELAVAGGQNSKVYILEYNGTDYVTVFNKTTADDAKVGEVGDFDKDGENEFVVVDYDNYLRVYEYNGTGYEETLTQAISSQFVAYNGDSGDIDGDGFPELLLCGYYGEYAIVDYNDGFNTTLEEKVSSSTVYACHFGDPDNDGDLEVILGYDNMLHYYEYVSLSKFKNTWNSTDFGSDWLTNYIEIEDGDSDGLDEILFIKPLPANDHPAVWGNKSGGPPFTEFWTYETEHGDECNDHIHALDADSDGYKTNLTATITLPSEDADWLEFRAHNFEVDPNISSVFAILSGSLGSSSEDGRYRLEDGSDDLITNLKADTWNNFVSNHCMIYDSPTTAETADHSVLAWVRFKESENVKFQDVGLWNDTKGRSSSRIRYDIKDANNNDSFSYLLVFSKGSPRLIDDWMPRIRAGKLPETSFMTPAGRSSKDTVASKH